MSSSLSTYLSLYLSAHLSLSLSTYVCIYMSINIRISYTSRTIDLPTYLSINPSILLSIHPKRPLKSKHILVYLTNRNYQAKL